MYTVIGGIKSRAMRVIWMLEELGEPFEHRAAPPRSDDVLAVNPAGKIPVLIEDNVPILDSTAILTYLADKHGKLTFPAGTLERARQDGLTQFLLDEFDSALWMAARHSFILPEEMRQSSIKDSLKWEFENSQRTLLARMGSGPFLMGDEMTVSDIILAHCLGWAMIAQFPILEGPLTDYATRMRARPAFKAALAR
jgi:glutathione S-transferase